MPRVIAQGRKSGGTWGAKFHEVGASLQGLILKDPVEQQANDLDTGKPKVWEDGKPVIQYIYDVLLVDETKCSKHCNWCAQAKPRTDEDPGVRRIYANWGQHKAIQNAIYANQPAELFGLLTLTYMANDLEKKKPGKAAPKLWGATYANPTDDQVDTVDKHLGVGAYAPASVAEPRYEDYIDDEPAF